MSSIHADREINVIRRLFIRNGIAPEPLVASYLRRRMRRALERTVKVPGELDSKFRRRLSSLRDRYQTLIRSALFDPRRYQTWFPSTENWIQLCIVLAKRHGEDGFEFVPLRPNANAENTFVQDCLVYGFLQDGARSVAEAARRASKEISKQRHQGGCYSSEDGSDPVIRDIEPKSLESGYSARKRQRRENSENDNLPPSLGGWIDANNHLRPFLATALAMTCWSEQRFFSPDELDRCIASCSEEHLLGPVKR